jgi:hypothetical protein
VRAVRGQAPAQVFPFDLSAFFPILSVMSEVSVKDGIKVLRRLNRPWHIQEFLNGLPYDPADFISSPVRVLEEGRAQCLEGALFGAACLRFAGWEPLIVDMRAVNDDDHVLAVFRKGGLWGAVSKSSCITLEYREPVYRSLRELVMSYFDFYLDDFGRLSLREYSRPFNLRMFDDRCWVTSGEDLGFIGEHLDGVKHYRLLGRAGESKLSKVDKTLIKVSMDGQSRRVFANARLR